MKKEVCWKCRYLIVNPGGFFKRKSKKGPCDRCLGQMTIFQEIDQNSIWLKYIPSKKKVTGKNSSDIKKKENKNKDNGAKS